MKVLVFIYGVLSYALGVAALLYLICFLDDQFVPRTVDAAPAGPDVAAALIDLGLVALFGFQHSLMARPAFKQRWTRVVPPPAERSTYVLVTAAVLALLFWQWRAIPGVVWHVDGGVGAALLQGLFWLGWAILLASTFMINHFDLFGLRQVWLRLKDEPYRPVPFVQVALYRFVRHPIMLGFLLGIWATPHMSRGHLLFALAITAYVFIGIFLEERDTRRALGESYERYRRETPLLVPWPRTKA